MRLYGALSSAAPQGGSSSRKTDLDKEEKLSFRNVFRVKERQERLTGLTTAPSPPACVIAGSAVACTDTAVAVPSLTVAAGKYANRVSPPTVSPPGLLPLLKGFWMTAWNKAESGGSQSPYPEIHCVPVIITGAGTEELTLGFSPPQIHHTSPLLLLLLTVLTTTDFTTIYCLSQSDSTTVGNQWPCPSTFCLTLPALLSVVSYWQQM